MRFGPFPHDNFSPDRFYNTIYDEDYIPLNVPALSTVPIIPLSIPQSPAAQIPNPTPAPASAVASELAATFADSGLVGESTPAPNPSSELNQRIHCQHSTRGRDEAVLSDARGPPLSLTPPPPPSSPALLT